MSTYGLKIVGANNTFVIDSEMGSASAMSLVYGPATASVNGTYTNYALGDLIFAKPNTTGGTGKIFTDMKNPSIPVCRQTAQTYVLLRPASEVTTTNQNGSTYGLKVLQKGHVSSATITSAGSGYSYAPAVTIAAPPSGVTATGTATISSGSVTGITITEEGKGYTSVPSITIAGPGGGGSTATATAVLGNRVMYDSRQTAKSINIKATKGSLGCNGGYNVPASHTSYPNSEQVYTSYNSDTYACMNHSYSHDFGMFEMHIGFDFKSGGTIIYHVGWWFLNAGGGATQFGSMTNLSELIIGDLIT